MQDCGAGIDAIAKAKPAAYAALHRAMIGTAC
jgi:hypothetical protein